MRLATCVCSGQGGAYQPCQDARYQYGSRKRSGIMLSRLARIKFPGGAWNNVKQSDRGLYDAVLSTILRGGLEYRKKWRMLQYSWHLIKLAVLRVRGCQADCEGGRRRMADRVTAGTLGSQPRGEHSCVERGCADGIGESHTYDNA